MLLLKHQPSDHQNHARFEITDAHFERSVGSPAIQDDLERSNCRFAGYFGHWGCGWDHERDMPMFIPGTAAYVDDDAVAVTG